MSRLFYKSMFFLLVPLFCYATVYVGVGKADLTPSAGTPSAGYYRPKSQVMKGVHDPLLALALFIENEDKKIVFCSVDHLGFPYRMVQNIIRQVQSDPELADCEIYIGSSHTHAGGGAYLDIPYVGELLAGPYDSKWVKYYQEQTVKAILEAKNNKVEAKVGVGYGEAEDISTYRGFWPKDVKPLSTVAILKVTTLDEKPLAVLFNFPMHPTILDKNNRLFSADFVGATRDHIQDRLGSTMQPIYFNGAQGDILPKIAKPEDLFESCQILGTCLAETVEHIWHATKVKETLTIETKKDRYSFHPQATPQGIVLPVARYDSEMNVIILNKKHAFLTIPGELSCLYDKYLKELGQSVGFKVSILGLVNDAHGYIILPESWRRKTFESNFSFGGENYGELINQKAQRLLGF